MTAREVAEKLEKNLGGRDEKPGRGGKGLSIVSMKDTNERKFEERDNRNAVNLAKIQQWKRGKWSERARREERGWWVPIG